MTILPYTSAFREDWNLVVQQGINSALVHHRGFLDYQGKKFEDCSLMIYEDEKLIGVFPAEKHDGTIVSHRGITFGDIIFGKKIGEEAICSIIQLIVEYYKNLGQSTLEIRNIPSFYWKDSELFHAYQQVLSNNGFISKENRSFQTITLPLKLTDRGRRWGVRKAHSLGLQVDPNGSLEGFWNKVLLPNLWETYQAKPVHSLEEIQHLKKQVPDSIQCWTVKLQEEVLAGVLTFNHQDVCHLQYTSVTAKGKKLRALDALMYDLIGRSSGTFRYVSMGTSIDPKTGKENSTLTQWKKSWGADVFETKTWEMNFDL